MPRKQVVEGGTKNKILEVGRRRFFENGFDATGIRAIMKEVGTDTSVFYYYFKSKDELFTKVLDDFFAPYHQDFQCLVDGSKETPFQSLLRFFDYVKNATMDFRSKYADKIHCTVRWAIRERMLTVIEPYIEQIINVLIDNGANPKMDAHLSAIFLSHGVGSVILHEEAQWVESVSLDMRKTINLLLGLDEKVSKEMFEKGKISDFKYPGVPLWNI